MTDRGIPVRELFAGPEIEGDVGKADRYYGEYSGYGKPYSKYGKKYGYGYGPAKT